MLKYYINFLTLLVFATVWSQTVVEKDGLPSELRYGLRLGIDISKPVRMLVEPTYKGLELVGDFDWGGDDVSCWSRQGLSWPCNGWPVPNK